MKPRILSLIFFSLFLTICNFAHSGQIFNPHTSKLDLCSDIEEIDGSPSNKGCKKLKVTNGALTDNGDGTFTLTTGVGGGGDVSGPGSSTDNAVTRFDGTGGKTLQNSSATIDDSGTVNIPLGQTYNIGGSAFSYSDLANPSKNKGIYFGAFTNTWTSTTGTNLWTAANTSGEYFKIVNSGNMASGGSILKVANTGNPTGGTLLEIQNTDTDMMSLKAPNLTLTQAGVLTVPSVVSALTGNASTSTALAANGANCSTSTHFSVGVDASGVAECEAIADADVPDTITVDNATTAANLGADGVDALTEIAQAIKTANDDTSKLVVGTAGSNGEIAKWNTDGTLTDSNLIISTLTDGRICKYTSSGTILTCDLTCADITGSADLCDGSDASGSGGSADSIAYHKITSPLTNSGIAFSSFTNTWTSSIGNANFFVIDGSGTDFVVQGDGDVITDDINVTGNITISGTVDGVDVSARDHAAVTLSGTPDYITLSGQDIVRGTVDVSDDTNLAVSGTLLTKTGDTLSIDEGTLTDGRYCYYSGGNLVCDRQCSDITGGSGLCDGSDATGGVGGSSTYDNIGDAEANTSIYFASFTNTWTSAIGDSDFFKIDGSTDFIVQGDGDVTAKSFTASGGGISTTNGDLTVNGGVTAKSWHGTANDSSGITFGAFTNTWTATGSSDFFKIDGSGTDFVVQADGDTTVADLTVGGGDIVLGTTSIFSGGDTASLNNIDAINATTETTFEAALDCADISGCGTGGTATSIAYDKITSPTTNSGISFAGFTNVWTSTTGNHVWTAANTAGDYFKVVNTGNMGANTSVLKISQTGNPTGGAMLAIENSDTDMVSIKANKFIVPQAGLVSCDTIDSNADGQLICGTDSGGGGSSNVNIILPVQSAKVTGTFPLDQDASQGAQIDAGDGNWRLLFDATTDEGAVWQFRMPNNYASTPVLKIDYTMASATTLEVEFEGAIMCVSDGDSADVGTASFSAIAVGSATVPGTAGYMDSISITLTDDSCAAGDMTWIYLSTDSDDATNDDATGDREVIGVTMSYTGS